MERLSFDLEDFASEKDYKKFVNAVKTIVRRSPEYNTWVDYIKYTLGYKHCQLTSESSDDLTVDLHHHPISLQNIVEIVLNNQLAKLGHTNSLQVAREVLELHYQNNVGYVLLVRSLHEKFHNGKLAIPIDIVLGNWKFIIENYQVPDEIMQTIKRYESVKVKPETWTKDNYNFVVDTLNQVEEVTHGDVC